MQVMYHLDGYVDINECAVLVGDAAHCSPVRLFTIIIAAQHLTNS